MDWKGFGIKIRDARLGKGLTQQELGEKIDVSAESICYYETGKKKPSFEKIKALCMILDIDINTI